MMPLQLRPSHIFESVYKAQNGEIVSNRCTFRSLYSPISPTWYFLDRIISNIGRGAFGTVVKAEDEATGAKVAVKLLHNQDDLHTDIHAERKIYETLVRGSDPHI